MADSTNKTILSVISTTSSKVKDLVIKDGQLIFVHDNHRIALDLNGKRTFYNQITELETEDERTSLLAPITGQYYFVIETAILWVFNNGWVQLTIPSEDIVFIGDDFPSLGKAKTLYVNKTEKYISAWDNTQKKYVTVADTTSDLSAEDIENLFK